MSVLWSLVAHRSNGELLGPRKGEMNLHFPLGLYQEYCGDQSTLVATCASWHYDTWMTKGTEDFLPAGQMVIPILLGSTAVRIIRTPGVSRYEP